MNLPNDLAAEVTAALAGVYGESVSLSGVRAVGGGCISSTGKVELDGGGRAFLKWSADGSQAGLLAAEAMSLERLRYTATVRVPEVLAAGERWLLLEWLEPGRIKGRGWTRFGLELAEMHRTTASSFGWPEDNFIGSLQQTNSWRSDWPTFWRDCRLAPQLELARRRGVLQREDLDLLDRLSDRLAEAIDVGSAERPSLLHGDLWCGNVHGLADGAAAIIDPSSYFGHREVDLAMADLFGGFDADFFRAYNEAWPLQPGYPERRRPIYQLYYLLVHVNLFGGSYAAGVRSAAHAALRAL